MVEYSEFDSCSLIGMANGIENCTLFFNAVQEHSHLCRAKNTFKSDITGKIYVQGTLHIAGEMW